MDIKAKYDVLSVCRHIINYCNKKTLYIDHLKLQKLLYFVQANFLFTSNGKVACFQEEIIAWRYGPVVVEAYNEFKVFGSSHIPKIEMIEELNTNAWDFEKIVFEDPIVKNGDDSQLIDETIDYFRDYSSTDLVNLTHRQSPWKEASAEGMNTIIHKKDIYEYFKNS